MCGNTRKRLSWDNSVLSIVNNNSIRKNHCALLPNYNLFVKTDVSTAFTTTVVLHMIYSKNFALTLLDGEGKVTLEQVMTTYRDSRKMSLLFFNTVEWG
jgi:hypothetical protein